MFITLKNKSLGRSFILVLICVLMLGVAWNNSVLAENKGDKVIILKWAHVAPLSTDKHTDSVKLIAKEIEERTNGKVKIEIYPASQLGNEREILEGVKLGTIEIATLSSGTLPGIFPEILVTSLPYLFPTRESAYNFFDGPMGNKMADIMLQKNGIRILAWGENGVRCFSNNVRPIRKPEDFKGLKIRTMENPAHMAIVKALGGTPCPIPFSEVYTALAQHTVDGQDNPPSLTHSMRFYEVLKYMSLDYHVYDPLALMVKETTFKSLPVDVQQVLREEALVWKDLERKMSVAQDKRVLKYMAKQGLQIVELSPEELKAFREATKSVYPIIADKVGKDFLDEVLSYVK